MKNDIKKSIKVVLGGFLNRFGFHKENELEMEGYGTGAYNDLYHLRW